MELLKKEEEKLLQTLKELEAENDALVLELDENDSQSRSDNQKRKNKVKSSIKKHFGQVWVNRCAIVRWFLCHVRVWRLVASAIYW